MSARGDRCVASQRSGSPPGRPQREAWRRGCAETRLPLNFFTGDARLEFFKIRYRAARLLSTFPSDRCFNNKAWGPQAMLYPCYGPLFPARARASRAKEKRDHNMGAMCAHTLNGTCEGLNSG